jgi:putative ABC transport system permease protein
MTFARDLVYALRVLLSRRTFTVIAVLTLALGIGANTAVFSVVHTLLLAPLPFPDPDRLVMMWEADAKDESNLTIVSAPNWQDWSRESQSFTHTAIWENQRFNIGGDPDPEQVRGLRVSASVFPMLGIPPRLGRAFAPEEDGPGHNVVVISDGLWRRRFGARPGVVGETMRLNGAPYEVVGVMPPSFAFPQKECAVWIPIAFTEEDASRSSHSFYAAARLKPEVEFASAKAEMRSIGGRLERLYGSNRGDTATITPMNDLGVSQLRPTLYALLGAVGMVLLIACVNVANLQLAQASARQREFAIRSALGARRRRLASQLLAEALILAAAGGALGVTLAWAATMGLAQSLPPAIRLAPFRDGGVAPLDSPVLAFTAGLCVLTALLFSLAPILGTSRDTAAALKGTGDRGGTARFTLLKSALVALELGLAVVVLAGAGLMIKSVIRLVAIDPGLDPHNVLTMDIALPQADLYGPPERKTFCQDVQREVAPLPGVVSVAAISHLPLSGANAGRSFAIEGRPEAAPGEGANAAYRLTCPGYFRTLGIPLVKGRDFSDRDATDAPHVVIVNETLAEKYWPAGDPLGKRIKFGRPDSDAPWMTIVGVARDVRHFGLDSAARREMFRPYAQAAWPGLTITIKTGVPPLSVAAAARAALARIDPDQPVSRVRPMQAVVQESIGSRRFPMLLLSLFSGIALLLAAIGVYGVVNQIVAQRTREMGIRLALGARAVQVTRLVLKRSLVPIAAGLGCGVVGALAAARLLASSELLFAVRSDDPGVLAAIVAVLATSAVAACLVPARRAASVDPLVILKEE